MLEQNKALYRRWVEEILKKKDLGAIEQFVSPTLVDHDAPPGFPQGLEGVRQLLSAYLVAFPDLDATIEDLIAEGDKVVARVTYSGTHKGDFMGIAPTGKRITTKGIEIVRITGDKVVEHWESFDMLGMMQQLGVVPK
ncbi:MAG: ester cyclase [Chloroflexi bacterium]|nr:ester cyclase [Chloroflexota bacterium]